MSVFIGGAWPYANGSLHIGHIAALLPGDILARYYRLQGEDVLYVSGSDCHGTPIAVKAKEEGVVPREITDQFHEEFVDCFDKLGFSYDLYTRTDDQFHHQEIKNIFTKLYENDYIYKQTISQAFCKECNQFLPDRYVEGICPECGKLARGDQCDFCSSLLDPADLEDKQCKLCENSPVEKETDQFFFALSEFQEQLEDYLDQAEGWRENAVNLTARYLEEGLPDRAATRNLDWGIDVPLTEEEEKKIYVWIDAVCGYLTASKQLAEESKVDWEDFWCNDGEQITAYYVHGKDNVPFHSLIFPALLSGLEEDLHLPDQIIASEYVTIENKQLSTSRNWAVWLPEIIDDYHPDSIRYFLTINGPEKRDADFSWREFVERHNGELLAAYGNFVNRSLQFIHKYFAGQVPEGTMNKEIKEEIEQLYQEIGKKIEAGNFKAALQQIFAFIRRANKYFDQQEPWIKRKEDKESCAQVLYTCVQIIANLSNLLYPFVPFSCGQIKEFLNLEQQGWEYIEVKPGREIHRVELLFERIEEERIEKEVAKLGSN